MQDPAGAVIEATRTFTLAGRAVSDAGDRDKGRDVLVRAREHFEERGAVRYRYAPNASCVSSATETIGARHPAPPAKASRA